LKEEAVGQAVTGKAPRAVGRFSSVILLEPIVLGDDTAKAPTEQLLMDQYGHNFHPGVLLVHKGQQVRFHNSEAELHNVRVVDAGSGSTLFNVATPENGHYDYRFEHSGFYDVSCDIHAGMAAFLIVTSTPYAVVAGNDGSFSLSDVPPGSYKLTLWTVDPSKRMEKVVEVSGDGVEIVLDGDPDF
jgi:plastocyanin